VHGLESYHGTWESLQLAWRVSKGGKVKKRESKNLPRSGLLELRIYSNNGGITNLILVTTAKVI
jgi:hypothetical protein